MKSASDRYEDIRQHCLRYGNVYPGSNAPCHEALMTRAAGNPPALMIELAALLDDMALALTANGRHARTLAVLAIQSERYRTDADFANAVDNVLDDTKEVVL